MRRSAILACLCLPLGAAALAADWWVKKPSEKWSASEVARMLDDSPWGKIYTITIMNPTFTGSRSYQSVGTGDLEREKRNIFHIRFLTARPVRMAFARLALLERQPKPDPASLSPFIERTDPDRIIVAVNITTEPRSSSSLHGYWAALMSLSTPALSSNTSLTTNTGKKVYIGLYRPPTGDGLGARYYFPRRLPDGTPLLTGAEREINFETQISLVEVGAHSATPGLGEQTRTDRIWVSFDLRKMVFEGQLEI